MQLAPHDIQSSSWQKLVAHYEPILVKLRARAENPELSETERLPLLHQIKFIKEFLEMGKTT